MPLFRWLAPFYDPAMKLVGHEKTLQKIIEKMELTKKDKLLDLGGGTGLLLEYLPEDLEITLVDSSDSMLNKAKNKDRKQKVNYVQASGSSLPLENNHFEHVVIADALHHFEKIEETIREAKRVLKPTGALYIMEFNPRFFFTKIISLAEKAAGEPANFLRPQELSSLIAKSGWQVEQFNVSQTLYILKAKKFA